MSVNSLRSLAGAALSVIVLTGCATMQSRWRHAESLNTVLGYDGFLSRYPEGTLADSARSKLERLSFPQAESVGTIEGYQDFLKTYPNGAYRVEAERAIEELAWRHATTRNTVEGYQAFLTQHPNGAHAAEARDGIEKLEWDRANATSTCEAYQTFLQQYPEGKYAAEAQQGIERLAWEAARACGTVAACDSFLGRYPNGHYSSEAGDFRANLIAEQRKGRLLGSFPNAKNLPPGYSMARIVTEDDGRGLLATIVGDIFSAFPSIDTTYSTELERETFLGSPEADSLRKVLSTRKAALIQDAYAIEVDPYCGFPAYSLGEAAFVVELRSFDIWPREASAEEISCYMTKAEHEVCGFWFDQLPLRARYLILLVDKALIISVPDRESALSIERRRGNLQVWIGFHLTGDTRTVQLPSYLGGDKNTYVEARDPVIMLIDRGSGDVVWRSR